MTERLPGELPVPDRSLFFICRLCTKMGEQWDKGIKTCQLKCGGPRKGMAFPEYAGPMTPTYRESHCFVCGMPAEGKIEVQVSYRSPGLLRIPDPKTLGICKKHLRFAVPGNAVEHPLLGTASDAGLIQRQVVTPVPLYEALGIDPVKDLGFNEQEEPKRG